ncbi:hypothetical protein [Microcoleus vaginatus]|uniref:hypothetical protein n=1 Tax=Microcoleus vaginatus TaxID=119532 RepID=UPI001F614B31|nr:hypothetical protein D0A37_25330 [Microcoleus vaginatus HSN003]
MTKRSQRNAWIKQPWESNSACAASTALLAAPIALTKSILSIKNRQKSFIYRTVRAEAKKSQPSIALGTRQAKNNQGFKGWRDLEARSYLHLKEFLTQKVNTFVLKGKI